MNRRGRQRGTAPSPFLTSAAAMSGVERIVAVGVAVSAAELLSLSRVFRDDGVFSWSVARTRNRWMTGRMKAEWGRLFRGAGIKLLLGTRVAAAVVLVAPVGSSTIRRVATTHLSLTGYLLALRSPYGGDGAESMSTLALTSAAAGRSVPGGAGSALGFLAMQSLLSYFVAGVAKLMSPMWMDGTAIRDIYRTRMYGVRQVFDFLQDRPRWCLVVGRSVAVSETLVPLVVFLPRPFGRACLVGLGLFHMGTAAVMGLNRFPLAFVGTYPAILWAAEACKRRGRSVP